MKMKFELNAHHRNVSEEELLDDLRRVADLYHKNTITRDEYKKLGKYGINTFTRRFGGWNSALERCGLIVDAKQRYAAKANYTAPFVTDEELIADLLRVSKALGKTQFSTGEYQKQGIYSRYTYLNHFGSWNNSLEAANLQPYSHVPGRKISTEDLFQEIERIWILLGRQPTSSDIQKGVSQYSLNTFTRHFGSWRSTLESFVAYISNSEDTTPNNVEYKGTDNNGKPVDNESVSKESKTEHETQREPGYRLRFIVMKRDNFKCRLCGASPAKDPSVELHVDHIVPWSRGGESTIDNLQTLCKRCNLGKSDTIE